MKLPPVTEALVSFLSAHVAVPFVTAVPEARPAEFGVVRASGGSPRNAGQVSPRFTVELWAASTVRAERLARDAWDALAGADGTFLSASVWVGDTSLTLPVDYPDALSRTPRWLFVYNPTINLTV